MVDHMSYTRSFCKTAVSEHCFFVLLRTPPPPAVGDAEGHAAAGGGGGGRGRAAGLRRRRDRGWGVCVGGGLRAQGISRGRPSRPQPPPLPLYQASLGPHRPLVRPSPDGTRAEGGLKWTEGGPRGRGKDRDAWEAHGRGRWCAGHAGQRCPLLLPPAVPPFSPFFVPCWGPPRRWSSHPAHTWAPETAGVR